MIVSGNCASILERSGPEPQYLRAGRRALKESADPGSCPARRRALAGILEGQRVPQEKRGRLSAIID